MLRCGEGGGPGHVQEVGQDALALSLWQGRRQEWMSYPVREGEDPLLAALFAAL